MNKTENCSNSPDKFEFPILNASSACCPAPAGNSQNRMAGLDQSFVTGSVNIPVGPVPQVTSELRRQDRWGAIKARWGVGRMDYTVDPGLYALDKPDSDSPVLVTANYKMSFDSLRAALPGRNAWILVLDTKGINVWCAAGKGTFGTGELINRIELSGLKNVVSHRKIILPQLGAPGVAAHQVKQTSGFKVHYGPIRAEDLPPYLESGLKTTPAMRIMTFPLKDRAVLIPIEVVAAVKPFLIIALSLFILSGIGGPAGFWANTVNYGLFAVLALLSAILSGAALIPLLLPYLPGRAFSLKGFFTGFVIALILLYLRNVNLQAWAGMIEALAWMLIIPAISSYLAMNFTGCSTYTSLSGVKKEMRWALPAQIAAGALGIVGWTTALLIA
jgi:acetyl-CoA decarbonylase/synthase complex subunit gamma